jgi:colanic acid biosynthesis glycosyl transferase WcaI
MSNKQGLDLIVEAARSLDQAGSSIRFVTCGEGPHKALLQSMSESLGNIQFLGLQPSETFAELSKTADAHLIPQRVEAANLVLPSKLGGIFATGRPVIVMARPDTGLAAELAGGGIVIPPGNTSALADALRNRSGHGAIVREMSAPVTVASSATRASFNNPLN